MDKLKLMALDQTDLEIISAHLQDAVLKVENLQYLPSKGQFVLIMNRFVWEKVPKGFFSRKEYERRQSALHFDRVTGVRAIGINRDRKDDVLELLAIRFEQADPEAPAGMIELTFAGNAAIRLDCECIEAQLTDLGPAWGTSHKPRHTV